MPRIITNLLFQRALLNQGFRGLYTFWINFALRSQVAKASFDAVQFQLDAKVLPNRQRLPHLVSPIVALAPY